MSHNYLIWNREKGPEHGAWVYTAEDEHAAWAACAEDHPEIATYEEGGSLVPGPEPGDEYDLIDVECKPGLTETEAEVLRDLRDSQ